MNQPNLGNMNGYYQRQQYPAEDMQTMTDINNNDAIMGMMMSNGMDPSGMVGGQTIDDIINMNKEHQRRRSIHQSQQYGANRGDVDPRRSSMMEFGSGITGDLAGFQFDPSPTQHHPDMQRAVNTAQQRIDSQRARRRDGADDLVLNTNFQNMGPGYSPAVTSSPYQHSLQHPNSLPLDLSGDYMSSNLLMGMDYPTNTLNHENNGDITPMNMYSSSSFAPHMDTSSMPQNVNSSLRGHAQDPGGGLNGTRGEQDVMEKMPDLRMSEPMQNLPSGLSQQSLTQQPVQFHNVPSAPPATALAGLPDLGTADNNQPTAIGNVATANGASTAPGTDSQNVAQPPVLPQYRNAYSASGFDMLGVLMRVATRPEAHINIGAVDMSCAFAVCDVTQHDLPIVYCSDIFERLTGYTKHEILGRNCRFLQAPDGKITPGVKRKYVDDQSVMRIKDMISQRQEMQISIINYRKGGQPFMNLLTMIPITWDSEEIKYYVGFQVDLVEQPTSITSKNPGETVASYAIALPHSYVLILRQMARTRSTTREVCYHGMNYQSTPIKPTPSWAKHLAAMKSPLFSVQSVRVSLSCLKGYGTRFCYKTPMTSSMCYL